MLSRFLVSLSLLLLAAGCGADVFVPLADGTSNSSADPEIIVDQNTRDDITTLRARETVMQLHPSTLFDACVEIEEVQGSLVRMDCTASAEATIATDFPDEPGPLAHQLVLLAYRNDDGTYSAPSSGIPCSLTQLETASRAGALPYMKRMGFFFSGNSRRERHFVLDDLQEIGAAMGKDGQLRVIHRFYAALPCWTGTASSSYYATYEFKPYMDFDGTDGKVYRNWDTVESNYVLTGGSGATEFDRSGEVLQ